LSWYSAGRDRVGIADVDAGSFDDALMSTARSQGWRPKVIRYEIDTCRRADPQDLRLLECAFGRVAAEWSDRVRRAVVSGPSGYVFVAMDFIGPPEDARRECERLYAIAWYDAFGVEGSTHVGRLVEEAVAA
jgi:hypothetical protein